MKAKYLLPAVATVLLISGVAMAQDDEVNWNSLTEAQQQVLGPVAENWDSLPIERRARLVEGRERFQTWQRLNDNERDAIRDRYNQFQRMTPREKARIRNNFRTFRDLPADRRQQLRDRYRNMTPDQRQKVRDRLRRRQQVRPRATDVP